MDESRRQFEEWAKEHGLLVQDDKIAMVNPYILDVCWKAWQASRAIKED